MLREKMLTLGQNVSYEQTGWKRGHVGRQVKYFLTGCLLWGLALAVLYGLHAYFGWNVDSAVYPMIIGGIMAFLHFTYFIQSHEFGDFFLLVAGLVLFMVGQLIQSQIDILDRL